MGSMKNNLEDILLRPQGKRSHGENLLRLLERRLDNVIYRLGFCGFQIPSKTDGAPRSYGVNGRKVDIPSFLVSADDEIEIREE